MPLVRSIGRWTMTALVINGIIGAGIFALPGELNRLLGRESPFAVICAVVAMAIVIACVTEVASQFSEPGGASFTPASLSDVSSECRRAGSSCSQSSGE
jgi:amino acid transporter